MPNVHANHAPNDALDSCGDADERSYPGGLSRMAIPLARAEARQVHGKAVNASLGNVIEARGPVRRRLAESVDKYDRAPGAFPFKREHGGHALFLRSRAFFAEAAMASAGLI